MKSVLIALSVACCIGSAGYGQPVVTLDSLGGTLVCGKLSQFSGPFTQYVAITNPDAEQKEIRFSLAFSVDDGQSLLDFDVQYLNGIESVFGTFGAVTSSIEQQGNATIVTLRAKNQIPTEPGGLPVSSDPIIYFGISFRLGYEQLYGTETVLIDSTASPTLGDWYFSSGTAPSFTGPSSWSVFASIPNCGATVSNPPPTLVASPCVPAQYDFNAGDLCGWPVHFELVNAPVGATIDPATGVFSWLPDQEHVGQQFEIGLVLSENLCPAGEPYYRTTDEITFIVDVIGCNPPQFVPGLPNAYVTTSEDDLIISRPVDDPDPINHYTYSWYVSVQDPTPPCELNQVTGEFHYLGTPADTNLYWICMVIHDGPYADTTRFYIYHFDTYICGDINHFGGITVSDLTWLIGYMFRGGLPPITTLAGDVDCGGDIKIADLTYLVAYLFRGGPAPCASCP